MTKREAFSRVAPSPSSRSGATPAPAGFPPRPAGASESLVMPLASGGDENHPESKYDSCHANYAGPDLHAVPAFSCVGENRFSGWKLGEVRR